jgi:hypothetical protein
MRKTLMAAALVLAFSCHAGAGIMHIPPAPEPEPAQTNTAQEPTTTDEDSGATDALTQTALDLLAALPSLL